MDDGRYIPLLELTRARFLEFVRDWSAIFWVFGFPVVIAVVLGIAFRNQGVELAPVAVTGRDAAPLLKKVGQPAGLELKPMTEPEADFALKTGKVDVVLRAASAASEAPRVSYRFDPSRPNAESTRLLIDGAVQRAYGRADPVVTALSPVEEKGGRYIDFLLPGLLGLNVMGSCMWGIGYSIVDARRRKLLKRFAVTPMNRSHFLLAFVLSRLVFLLLEIAALVAFGWIAFDVEVHGSIAAVLTLALLGTTAFFGMALLIASRTESTEVASGWMNFAQLPMWLFSGAFFSYERFPEAIHPAIRLLPLTALNDSIRAVVNQGESLWAQLPHIAVLCAWSLVCFFAALRIFKWQ